MLYVRGNKYDYDEWAAMGNTGWSYSDVLPYFIKSEDQKNPYLAKTPYHGTGGYLTVSEAAYRTPLAAAFVQGGVEMGYPHRDCNGESQLGKFIYKNVHYCSMIYYELMFIDAGFMYAQGTVRDGTRCSTNKAFLRPVRHRSNLHISTNSYVLKILIDSSTKVAYGVQFEKNGKIYNVNANKEVILSGGSIGSPQILMLSGVGPAAHLQSLGINVIADLPVGDNLQDHVAAAGLTFTIDQPYSLLEDRYLNFPTILNYTVYGNSPFSIIGGVEGLAWVRSKYAYKTQPDRPDIQFHFAAGSDISDNGSNVRIGHGLSDAVWDSYFKPLLYKDTWSMLTGPINPNSKGTVRVNSADPYDKPIIDPKYFDDPQDIKVQIEGIKIGLALSKTEAFQKLGTTFYNATFPGCESFIPWADDYWGCFVKQYPVSLVHTGGTCRMGNSTDLNSVVDPTLKVKGGISGLRVADTSVMPALPAGNTNAVAVII